MTHEQLVEKVARAMAEDANDHFDQARLFYMRRSKAAIAAIYEAMREPTPDQLTTAGTMAGWNEAAHRGADDCHVEWWQAMLDASPLKGE